MATIGMLGELFSDPRKQLRQEQLDDDKRLDALAADPFRAMARTSYEGAQMAGKGLGRVAAAAAGKDPRTTTERNVDAVEAAKAEMAGLELDPNNPDAYYRTMIGVLSKHGLTGEAHAAAQEWHNYKNEQADRQVKIDETARKTEDARRKAAIAEEANRIKKERNAQLAQQGMPEFIQIIDRVEQQSNPVLRKAMLDRVNQMAGGKVVLEDAGDRVLVRNQRGELLGVDMAGEKPMNEKDRLKVDEKKKALGPAYQASMVAAQTDYKAAADLYNHPGLDNLIGKYSGLAAERGTDKDGMLREAAIAALSPEGQEALALFQQVQGGAFVRALQDLKTAGGGSTGLGQVTEIEGQKITAAKGALFPRQQVASFRKNLANYISVIEQSANILAGKAQEDGLDPIYLNIVELTGPIRGAAPTRAPTAPRAATRAAPAAGGDRVRVLRPDGQTGTIPRAKLEEYKRKGYTEIK